MNPGEQLINAAHKGDVAAMSEAYALGVNGDDIEEAFCEAAHKGHLPAMKLVGLWVTPEEGLYFNTARLMAYTADGGSFAAMKWLIAWIDQMHSWRCQRELILGTPSDRAIELANLWKSDVLYGAIIRAAACGFKNGMKRLRRHATKRGQWPPRTYLPSDTVQDALEAAARRGKIETLRLARQWGATNYEVALRAATSYGKVQVMGLLLAWGAKNIDAAIAAAIDLVQKATRVAYREYLTRAMVWLQDYKARTVIASMGLALHSLNLPLYVELWIGEWVASDGSVTPARRVEQIQRLRESIRRVKGIPLES